MANHACHSTLAIGIVLCLLATGHVGAEDYPQIPRGALYARLPVQALFVAWALAARRPT